MAQPGNLAPRADAGRGHAEYDFLRRHQLDSFHSQLPSFLAAATWPAEQLQAKRQEWLRALVAHAKARSPWHAKRLAHVDPDQLSEGTLSQIPPMTKRDVMESFDEIVTDSSVKRADVEAHLAGLSGDRYFHETCHAITSGGSSGTRGVFVYDWSGWITFGLSSARPIALALQQSPSAVRQKAVAFVGDHATLASTAFTQSFAPWLLAQFREFVPLPMSLPIPAIVERLNAIQPTCISAYPSFLHRLSFAASSGELRIKPAAILVGGETLLPEHRKTIAQTFGARLFDFYGCSEASCLAFSCPTGDGLHLCDDTAICEPVDRTGRPTAVGETSEKVLLTNLFNKLLPLIRYELDDFVVPMEQGAKCQCGSAFRKVQAVTGRFDEVFVYENGVTIHPFLFRSVLGRDTIIEYQVRQTRSGAMVAVHATGEIDHDALASQLSQQLIHHGLRDPVVSIGGAEKIERTAAGKLRRSIPLPA